MAKKRLIPKLQLMPSNLNIGEFSLVTTKNFNSPIEVGNPISQAKIYESQAVDELIFVDLSHSKDLKNHNSVTKMLNDVAKEVFLPLTMGGGVKSVDDVSILLNSGADKVAINSAALEEPNIISKLAKKFGSQCIVVSIDFKKLKGDEYKVFGKSGSIQYDYDPIDWALKAESLGAGEILLCSIDHDGARNGLEYKVSKQICETLSIPVILSGGCGRANHFTDGFLKMGADAVAAGTFFCFQDQNPMQTRGHIRNAGIEIRTQT